MATINDYHGRPLAIGDRVRNIESARISQIMATEPDHNEPFAQMLVCFGVNFWDGELNQDDKQWHAPADVVLAARVPSAEDPVNWLNVL